MKRRKLLDRRQFMGLLMLPFAAIVLLFIIAAVQAVTRYDAAYFNAEYESRYPSPGLVAGDLEQALRSGDAALWHAAHATSYTPAFEPNPNMIFATLLDTQGAYFNYLFFDFRTYDRYTYHVKRVGGRYAAVDEGVYYYVDSGRWTATALPLMYVWWLLVLLYTAIRVVSRYMAGVRDQMYRRGV
jgi:hypothetical protein